MEEEKTTRQLTFHYIGNVHLPVSLKYNACAFTQKIHKLCEMLLSRGHKVILYGSQGSDAPCSELVITHKIADIKAPFKGVVNYIIVTPPISKGEPVAMISKLQ